MIPLNYLGGALVMMGTVNFMDGLYTTLGSGSTNDYFHGRYRYRLEHYLMRTEQEKKSRREYGHRWRAANPEKVAAILHRHYVKNKAVLLERSGVYKLKLKTEALTHYGNGVLACVTCGERRAACLTIDHIEGNGEKHRKSISVQSGIPFYRWLIRSDFPDGFQTLCMNCNWVKRVENNEEN